jgi:hypothetical protein
LKAFVVHFDHSSVDPVFITFISAVGHHLSTSLGLVKPPTTETFQAHSELISTSAVDKEADGEVHEVDELEHLLPGSLLLRLFGAAAEQMMKKGENLKNMTWQVQ